MLGTDQLRDLDVPELLRPKLGPETCTRQFSLHNQQSHSQHSPYHQVYLSGVQVMKGDVCACSGCLEDRKNQWVSSRLHTRNLQSHRLTRPIPRSLPPSTVLVYPRLHPEAHLQTAEVSQRFGRIGTVLTWTTGVEVSPMYDLSDLIRFAWTQRDVDYEIYHSPRGGRCSTYP